MRTMVADVIAPLNLSIARIEPIASREDFILDKCRGRNVLHVGCTDWPLTIERIETNTLLHAGITRVAAKCVGLDLSEKGIADLAKIGLNNVDFGNAEKMDTARYIAAGIDLIVAGEVIEHLNNPGLFLEGCAAILSKQGELLITVPNAFVPSRFVRLLFGTEAVHRDHVAYYSPKTMAELLRRYGFQVTMLGLTYPYPKNPLLTPWKLLGYGLHRLRPLFGWSCVFVARIGATNVPVRRVLS